LRGKKRMKNDECIIYLITKSGWKQTYKRDKTGWVQITNGVKRKMTSEQLISHILPVIAWNKNGIDYRQGSKLIVRKKKVGK
jgi:hypothetical protein